MSIDALKKAGVEVTVPSAEQRALFGELAKPVYPQVVSEEILKRFLTTAEKYR
jgi:hypothetical protein